MSAPADRLDRALLRRTVEELRVAFLDADAVVADLLRPPRERELGHREHVRIYTEARKKIFATLDWLLRALGDDPPVQ